MTTTDIGSSGNDRINDLDPVATTVYGLAGDDYLSSGNGSDWLNGGAGNDLLVGRYGSDREIGGDGNDRLFGWSGSDVLGGGNGEDIIYGGEDNDILWGGADNDRFSGGFGDDRIFGDDGNDTTYAGPGDDLVLGGNGDDYIVGGLGNDQIGAGLGNDTVYATYGDDIIGGGFGVDMGADLLFGGAGNDMFSFETGTVTMGPGDDVINLGGSSEPDENSGEIYNFIGDLTVTDFVSGHDRIVMSWQSGANIAFDDDGILQAGDPGVTQVGVDMVIDWRLFLGVETTGALTLLGVTQLELGTDLVF